MLAINSWLSVLGKDISIHLFLRYLSKIRAVHLLEVMLAHYLLVYIGFRYAGEAISESLIDFTYFYVVTSSTIGFGDLTPKTDTGKMIVTFGMIPFCVTMFTAILGKMLQVFINYIRKELMGAMSYNNYVNHIILFGYNHKRTHEFVHHFNEERTLDQSGKKLVLVTDQPMENPFTDQKFVHFCVVSDLFSDKEIQRTGISGCTDAVVDLGSDDANFVFSTHIARKIKKDAHISTLLDDVNKAHTLQRLHGNIEAITDCRDELLLRCTSDSGASRTIQRLSSPGQGLTLMVMNMPSDVQCTASELRSALVKKGAFLVGIAKDQLANEFYPLPKDEMYLEPSDFVHYISPQRLHYIDLFSPK